MLAWFVDEIAPGAAAGDEDPYEVLEREAAALRPGETGLVALDWWNGNRTILADADLTGVIAGLTLSTTPRDVYRALLEAIAFGNRRIMDNFAEHGLELGEIVACGGIAEKSPLLMQLIADTSGREVRVPDSSQIPARGAALFGAVAAGHFADIGEAISATRPVTARRYVARSRCEGGPRPRLRDLPRSLRDPGPLARRPAARAQAHARHGTGTHRRGERHRRLRGGPP